MQLDYELLDSGDGRKLERFGSRVLARPSSWAAWRPRLTEVWQQCDAAFIPKQGWQYGADKFLGWDFAVAENLKIKLELQNNGQIGVFPEHASYLPDVLAAGGEKVLSLFAYTGLATTICLSAGREVTHVELSNRVIEWAKGNLTLNNLPINKARFVQDDALMYLERLRKRGEKFDVIIADPPSFSRVSAKKTWTLGEEMARIVELLESVRAPQGRIFLTAHEADVGPCSVRNLVLDLKIPAEQVVRSELVLQENTGRELPSGFLVRW